MPWTAEQVIALAPDASAAKAGRELATERRWTNLGRSEVAIWGECKGSAAQPYQTQIDLAEPAFRCTCPSRKFPCKHALGLFLIYAARPNGLPEGKPPAWVEAWLQSRRDKSAKAAAPKHAARPPSAEKAAAEAEKRAARRSARAEDGISELKLWLHDMLAEGLAELPRRPQAFWAVIAGHLVDAQVPGLARAVEEMSAISNSGPGWPNRMLARLGRLQLLIEAAERLDTLEPGLQSEVRAALGFNESKDDVLRLGERVDDDWLVSGRSVRTEDRLKMQRTWLRGLRSDRMCLVLDFAAGTQTLDQSLIPGTHFEAEVRFYPGTRSLRGLVASRKTEPSQLDRLAGEEMVETALRAYAGLLAASPFLERAPLSLERVTPRSRDGGWYLSDASGDSIRLASGPACWRIQAMSGGRPLAVFGEWDGARLSPLAAYAEGEFANLQSLAS